MIFIYTSVILLIISIILLFKSNIQIETKLYNETLLLGTMHRLNELKNARFTTMYFRDKWLDYLRSERIELNGLEKVVRENPFIVKEKDFKKYIKFLSEAYKTLIELQEKERKYLEIKKYDEGETPCFSL